MPSAFSEADYICPGPGWPKTFRKAFRRTSFGCDSNVVLWVVGERYGRLSTPCLRTQRMSSPYEQLRIRFYIHQNFPGDDFGVSKIKVKRGGIPIHRHLRMDEPSMFWKAAVFSR
jgi:hypothetical protein